MFVINREKGELEAHFGTGEVVRMPIDSGIAGKVAMTGKTVNIQDAYKDPDFNPAVDVSTGYRTKSMLCLPIWHENPAGDEIVAVAQLINKLEDGQVSEFTQADVTTFNAFSGYAAASLRNAQLHRTSQLSLQQAQACCVACVCCCAVLCSCVLMSQRYAAITVLLCAWVWGEGKGCYGRIAPFHAPLPPFPWAHHHFRPS